MPPVTLIALLLVVPPVWLMLLGAGWVCDRCEEWEVA